MTVHPNILADSSLTSSEKTWITTLCNSEYGQHHLFDEATDPQGVKRLIAQIEAADKTYPGGLLNYIKRARKLLCDLKAGVNPFEGYNPKIPLGENLITGTKEYNEYENLGIKEIRNVAFVLVAGGLGERLGYPGIKIALPIETVTGMTYIEYYIRMILACEAYVEKTTGQKPKLPLAVMTSEDTNAATVQLLKEHNNFGLPDDQITIMKQEKVPSLIDNDARIAISSKDKYAIETKPHGHGDVHTLLNQHGLPEKWLKEGREWLLLFQDTNGLVSHAVAPLLGVSKKLGLSMNSLTVPRKAGEAVGAICKLERSNGESLTINVEYNQLTPLFIANGMEGGDVADPATGYSKYPGNTNVLVFHLPRYSQILKETGGTIPEFVNPKYADTTKTLFKSPTRLECMMQEFPRLFNKQDKVGSTQLDRWLCFSTVKNNVTDAALKSKTGNPPDSPFTGESDGFYANAKLLELAAKAKCTSVDIAQPVPTSFLGVQYQLGPKVIIMPGFGTTLQQIKDHLEGGELKITQGSTVILDGDVQINGLSVDGAVSIKAAKGKSLRVKNLQVKNEGINFVPLSETHAKEVPVAIQIRGYEAKCLGTTELSSN